MNKRFTWAGSIKFEYLRNVKEGEIDMVKHTLRYL